MSGKTAIIIGSVVGEWCCARMMVVVAYRMSGYLGGVVFIGLIICIWQYIVRGRRRTAAANARAQAIASQKHTSQNDVLLENKENSYDHDGRLPSIEEPRLGPVRTNWPPDPSQFHPHYAA